MPTIKDVARAANVSVGTVSHYLNGTARVGPERAERIQRAIDELGYQVDLAARGLRVGATRTVGLIVPNISNPFFGEVARAIEHALTERGYQTFLCDSSDDPAREDAYLANLASRRVDGALVIYADERTKGAGRRRDDAVPIVFVDREVEDRPSVTSDNRLGGRLAARHLAELGHRRIAVMVGSPGVRNVQHRLTGFEEELASRGLSVLDGGVVRGGQTLALGSRVDELLALPEPPTAVFCTNDIVAVGAWQKLLSRGVRVPSDVSLIGFDDIELARTILPPLTTVAQDKQALGVRAVERLLASIPSGEADRSASPDDAPLTESIEPRLVVRESTAPPHPARARAREAG
jgi:LacI family transcriptional regulator